MTQPHSHPRGRILIVDDEIFNQHLLLRILRHDYDLGSASNGAEALEMLQTEAYDLVLLDMMMPVLNGIETLIEIRANADLAELPVIIISAISETEQVVNAIKLGANDYITKPLDVSMVMARVQTQVALKRLTDERREVLVALEAANQLKSRMMQVASHDLRNPLNNLKMLLTVVKAAVQDQPDIASLMPIADKGIESMIEIIQDFLSTATMENNSVSLILEKVRGAKLLEQVIEQYSLAADAKAIQLDLDLQDGWVIADIRRVQQIFGNLLSNAIKYSPAASQVLLKSRIQGEYWRVEIYDSGAGIPENEHQHLFKPFSKDLISTKPTNGESSTGLGLWIAAEMMRLQGGKIGMDSPASGGCCFWLEFPIVLEKRLVRAG
jgi:two-component system sensor histidine kinase/response regulator